MNSILGWLPAVVLLTCTFAEVMAQGASEGVRRFAFGTPTSVTRAEFTKVTVKDRFTPEKGYGFLIRPTGEDLFVHHSEVEGDPSALAPNGDVEYEVGRNDRGPNARSVRTI